MAYQPVSDTSPTPATSAKDRFITWARMRRVGAAGALATLLAACGKDASLTKKIDAARIAASNTTSSAPANNNQGQGQDTGNDDDPFGSSTGGSTTTLAPSGSSTTTLPMGGATTTTYPGSGANGVPQPQQFTRPVGWYDASLAGRAGKTPSASDCTWLASQNAAGLKPLLNGTSPSTYSVYIVDSPTKDTSEFDLGTQGAVLVFGSIGEVDYGSQVTVKVASRDLDGNRPFGAGSATVNIPGHLKPGALVVPWPAGAAQPAPTRVPRGGDFFAAVVSIETSEKGTNPNTATPGKFAWGNDKQAIQAVAASWAAGLSGVSATHPGVFETTATLASCGIITSPTGRDIPGNGGTGGLTPIG